MKFPKMKVLPEQEKELFRFLGYCHTAAPGVGQFYDCRNLTDRDYPALSVREKREIYAEPAAFTGMTARDSLVYADGSRLIIDGYPLEMGLNGEPKQLISMGAYLLIFPDKKFLNTVDFSDRGEIEVENTAASLSLSLCSMEGEAVFPDYRGSEAPEEPGNGALWLDESGSPHVLQVYSAATGLWTELESPYVKLEAPGIGRNLREGDGIFLSGSWVETVSGATGQELESLFGNCIVKAAGTDYLVVVGLLSENHSLSGSFTAERRLPEMDFLCQSGNRLWGCRYGLNRQGETVNEIYASKLGDFRNFYCFQGISTDSYIVSLGSDGVFTGAVTYLGQPLFFKEDQLHRIYGSQPSNFVIQTTPCRGVEKGSHRSLAMAEEKLLYKSRDGVCLYDGSLPSLISQDLGTEPYHNGVGGALGSRYYVAMEAADGEKAVFVYNLSTHIWHREDGMEPTAFCCCRGALYAMDALSGKLLTLGGTGGPMEQDIPFLAETGELGQMGSGTNYPIRILLRMELEPETRMEISVQYDRSGFWEPMWSYAGGKGGLMPVYLRPHRCQSYRLRVQGKGQARLHYACIYEGRGTDSL